MKFLFFVAIIAAAVVLAAWLLPWWATLALVVLVLAPVVWIAWRIIRAIKKEIVPALKGVAERMPRSQERLCSLPADEPFRGNGFAFTFPVPCEVSQTVIDDLEALILKPAAAGADGSPAGLLIVSTIPRDELKTKISTQLDDVFTKVQAGLAERGRPGEELQTETFQPLEVGPLHGEYRQFKAANAEKKIRGETVFLGGEAFSVAWALAGPEDKFDDAAKRYRELAGLIKRVQETPVIDVPADGSFRTEDAYRQTRARQLTMTPQTLAQLRKFGATDQSRLKLEYFFYTNTKEKAAALAQKLAGLGYAGSHDRSAGDQNQFVVTGWTARMNMDDQTVLDWTGRMCDLGQAHDCEFDGWGTNPKQADKD